MKRLLSLLLTGTGLLCSACAPSEKSSQAPPSPAPSLTAAAACTPSRRPRVERREISVSAGGEIGGILYVPQSEKPLPLIILSHGLGATHASLEDWAQRFSRETGAAAFCFDFRGCGSLSSGSPTQMSVMTEAEDVAAVMDAARSWNFVDPGKIVLLGESQGGFACAAAAAAQPELPAALVLLYPAFVIPDHIHARFASPEEVPDVFEQLGVTLGARYALDLWDYDVFQEIGFYRGPVLLIHGTADNIVPVSYSQQAAAVYPDAELIEVEGAGHGFFAERSQAFLDTVQFLESAGILSA